MDDRSALCLTISEAASLLQAIAEVDRVVSRNDEEETLSGDGHDPLVDFAFLPPPEKQRLFQEAWHIARGQAALLPTPLHVAAVVSVFFDRRASDAPST